MIITPTVADAGTYICSASSGIDGEHKEASVSITFIRKLLLTISNPNSLYIEPANFTDAPFEQHPKDGADAKIVCRVTSSPAPEIVWSRQESPIDEG